MPKTAQKDASVATVKKQGAVMKHIKKYWQWYAMMFIPIVYYIVFRYIPMFGNIIAFRRYRAGSSIFGDEWSGLKYFNQFMKDQNFWRAFKNTWSIRACAARMTTSGPICGAARPPVTVRAATC